jgi:FecR protein
MSSWLDNANLWSWIVGVLLSVVICATPSPGRAQNIVGSVTAITGSAELQRGGATLKVSAPMPVELNDRFTTAAASQLVITLLDNSSLTLSESSSLSIDENVVTGGARASTKVSLLGGSLHSVITRALRAGTPTFEVNTPNAVAGVRGTSFALRVTSGMPRDGFPGCLDFTDEATEDGTVANWNKANPSAVVETLAGEYTITACDAVPTPAATGGLPVLSAPIGPMGALLSSPLFPVIVTGAGAGVVATGIYAAVGGFSGTSAPSVTPFQ